jgi:hypothetical protein
VFVENDSSERVNRGMAKQIYVPLEVDYYHNAKFNGLSEAAEVLWLRSLCYAKDHLTDGELTLGQLRFLGLDNLDERIAELVTARLWTPTDRGWLISGFLKRNKSAAEVEQTSEIRRQAALAKCEQSVSKVHSKVPAKCEQVAKQSVSKTPPRVQSTKLKAVQPPLPPEKREGDEAEIPPTEEEDADVSHVDSATRQQFADVGRSEVAAWDKDFPTSTRGLIDRNLDQLAYIRLQRDEGKTAADLASYRAYLRATDSVPRFWIRPRELTEPTKQGRGPPLWALIEQRIEADKQEQARGDRGGSREPAEVEDHPDLRLLRQ